MNVSNLTHVTQDVGSFLEQTIDQLRELGLHAYMLTDAIPGFDGSCIGFREGLSTLLASILDGTFGPTDESDFLDTVFAVVLTKSDKTPPEPGDIEACVTVSWYAFGNPFKLAIDLGCFTVKADLHKDAGLVMVNAVECFLISLIYKRDDDTLMDYMRRSNNEISMICRVDTGDTGHVELVKSLGFDKTNDDWGQVAGLDEVFRRVVIFAPMTPPPDSPVGSDTY